jgi:hypothetical protein
MITAREFGRYSSPYMKKGLSDIPFLLWKRVLKNLR